MSNALDIYDAMKKQTVSKPSALDIYDAMKQQQSGTIGTPGKTRKPTAKELAGIDEAPLNPVEERLAPIFGGDPHVAEQAAAKVISGLSMGTVNPAWGAQHSDITAYQSKQREHGNLAAEGTGSLVGLFLTGQAEGAIGTLAKRVAPQAIARVPGLYKAVAISEGVLSKAEQARLAIASKGVAGKVVAHGLKMTAHMLTPTKPLTALAASQTARTLGPDVERQLRADYDPSIDKQTKPGLVRTALKDLPRALIETPLAFAAFKAEIARNPHGAIHGMLDPFINWRQSFEERPVSTILLYYLVGRDVIGKAASGLNDSRMQSLWMQGVEHLKNGDGEAGLGKFAEALKRSPQWQTMTEAQQKQVWQHVVTQSAKFIDLQAGGAQQAAYRAAEQAKSQGYSGSSEGVQPVPAGLPEPVRELPTPVEPPVEAPTMPIGIAVIGKPFESPTLGAVTPTSITGDFIVAQTSAGTFIKVHKDEWDGVPVAEPPAAVAYPPESTAMDTPVVTQPDMAIPAPVEPVPEPEPIPTAMEAPTTSQTDVVIPDEPTPVIPQTEVAPITALPADLRSATPRYGYKGLNHTLDFESDIDKAAYIVRNYEKKSKADERYLEFLRPHFPNLSTGEIRALGRAVASEIKGLVQNATESTTVKVPTVLDTKNSAASVPSSDTPTVPEQKPAVADRPTSDKYYARNGAGEFVEVEGKPVVIPGFEDLDLFMHKELNGKGYVISDGSTGLAIWSGPFKKILLAEAQQAMEKAGLEKTRALIAKRFADAPSPRYLKQDNATDTQPQIVVKDTAGNTVHTIPVEPAPIPAPEATSVPVDSAENGGIIREESKPDEQPTRTDNPIRETGGGSPKGEQAADVPVSTGEGQTPSAPVPATGKDEGHNAGSSSGRPQHSGGGGDSVPRLPADRTDEPTSKPVEPVKDTVPSPPDEPGIVRTNFSYPDPSEIGDTSEREKQDDLLAAIRVLKLIEKENRLATPDEQAIIAKFPGWGWTGNLLKDVPKEQWSDHGSFYRGLREILTEDEWKAARSATLNSHYTAPEVITAMWEALNAMGFHSGRALEPSAGSGLFIGLEPASSLGKTRWTAVELDDLTGRILKQLYQKADVHIAGFEQLRVPDGSFDVAISNVPFGNYPIHDAAYNHEKKALRSRIHNYFFAKSLEKVRAGGLIAFISSHGTLDARDSVGTFTRTFLADNADMVGAIRLPNNAFKRNAGTEVTTDIIFLQKRAPDQPSNGVPFTTVKEFTVPNELDDKGKPAVAHVNEYFLDHPEMVLGRHSLTGKMRARSGEYTVVPDKSTPIETQLAKAMATLPKGIYEPATHAISATASSAGIKAGRFGSYQIDANGDIAQESANGREIIPFKNAKDKAVVTSFVQLRDAVKAVVQGHLENVDDAGLAKLQKQLKAAYDSYVKQHGTVNTKIRGSRKTPVEKIWLDDPEAHIVLALEDWDSRAGKVKSKSDLFTKRVIRPSQEVESVASVDDALVASMSNRNGIDLPYMAKLYGKTEAQIQAELEKKGLAYRDPIDGLVTKDEYGSGNVVRKLRQAEMMAGKEGDEWQKNVDFLKTVQPKRIPINDIYAPLGSRWIPTEIVDDFIQHLLGRNFDMSMVFHPATGKWKADLGRYVNRHAGAVNQVWGTADVDAVDLFLDIFNGSPTEVYRTVSVPGGGKSRVFDEDATREAQQKRLAIVEEWARWHTELPETSAALESAYNNIVNVYAPRVYDGSHLSMEGCLPTWKWRAFQKDFIWRGLQRQFNLFAAEAGSGKTGIEIAIAMEARRIGISQKPVLGVQGSTAGQIAATAARLYPGAKVLVFKTGMHANQRKMAYARLMTEDWDLVLMPHTTLEMIPVHPDVVSAFYDGKLEELRAARDAAGGDKDTVKEIEKAIKRLKAKMDDKLAKLHALGDDAVYWDDIGVDMLLLDEAHRYKNLAYASARKGLGLEGNLMTFDLEMKLNGLRSRGGRASFLTGTPVTNSIAELYSLTRYLAPELLEEQGVTDFDSWLTQYAEIETKLVRSTSGDYQYKDLPVRFSNVPELMQQVTQFTEFITADKIPELTRPTLRDKHGAVTNRPIVIQVPVNPMQRDYFIQLSERARNIPPRPQKGDDNHVNISTDGRHVTLDVRSRVPDAPDYKNSKINHVVRNVLEVYKRPDVKQNKRTQLVFMDLCTPQGDDSRLDLYADMTRKLIKAGIPKTEIRAIYDIPSTKKDADELKAELFDEVNAGNVRVLLGSRGLLGVGVNVQERLAAIHQVDPTWRPDQMEQADKRGIRHGNLFEADGIQIYQYVVPNSYDAFMWNKIAVKAGPIRQLMQGRTTVRSIENIGEGESFSPDQIDAIASGNLDLQNLIVVRDDIKSLQNDKRAFERKKPEMRQRIQDIENYVIPRSEERLAMLDEIGKAVQPPSNEKEFTITVDGVETKGREAANEALLKTYVPGSGNYRKVADYRGLSIFVRALGGAHDGGRTFALGASAATDSAKLETNAVTLHGFDNAISRLDVMMNEQRAKLAESANDIETIKAHLDDKWKHQEELDTLKGKEKALSDSVGHLLTQGRHSWGENVKFERRHQTLWDGKYDDMEEEPLPDSAPDISAMQEDAPATPPEDGDAAGEPTEPRVATATAPEAKKTAPSGKIVTGEQIIKELEKAVAPIRAGKIKGPKDVVATVQAWSEVIRTRKTHSIMNAFHEAGHVIQKRLFPYPMRRSTGLQAGAFPKAFWRELAGMAYEGAKKPVVEGFGEFVMHYFSDPITAHELAPAFYDEFERRLDANPEVKTAVTRVQELFADWNRMDPWEWGRSIISMGEADPKRPWDFDRLYAAAFDSQHPIAVAERDITKGKGLPSVESFSDEAVLYRGIDAVAQGWIKDGVADLTGNREGPSLESIVTGIDDWEKFAVYAVAMHGIEVVKAKGRDAVPDAPGGDPLSLFEQIVGEAPEKYEKSLLDLVDYSRSCLRLLVDSGCVSTDAAKAMQKAYKWYVPFFRKMDLSMTYGGGAGKRISDTQQGVRKLKGSGRPIIDPLESIVKFTYQAHRLAGKNRILNLLREAAIKHEGSGWVAEIVKDKYRPITTTLADVLHMNPEEFGDAVFSMVGDSEGFVDLINALDPESMRMIFLPDLTISGKDKAAGIVRVFVNGHPWRMQLDPDLYAAVAGLDDQAIDVFSKTFGFFTRLLRAGATLTPDFAIARNPLRDILDAVMNSNAELTPLDFARGFLASIANNELAQMFQASGAAHSMIVSMDRNYMQTSLKEIKARSPREKVINALLHPLDAMRKLGEWMERGSRLTEFGANSEWGESQDPNVKRRAAIAAREVTIDFSRQGWLSKKINQIDAFFTATLGGNDKARRMLFGKKFYKRTWRRGLLWLTLPTILLFLRNHKDERYNSLSEWQRDLYWCVYLDNEEDTQPILVPKPHLYGLIFATIPERLMRWAVDQDPNAFENLGADSIQSLFPTILPTVLNPLKEIWQNKSFTGSPIVPERDQHKQPRDQYGTRTTSGARLLGGLVNISPYRIDYLVNGWTGGLGRYAMKGASAILDETGATHVAPKPASGPENIPVWGALHGSPWRRSVQVDRFYTEYNALREAKSSERLTPKQEDRLDAMTDQANILSGIGKISRAIEKAENDHEMRSVVEAGGLILRADENIHTAKRRLLLQLIKETSVVAAANLDKTDQRTLDRWGTYGSVKSWSEKELLGRDTQ